MPTRAKPSSPVDEVVELFQAKGLPLEPLSKTELAKLERAAGAKVPVALKVLYAKIGFVFSPFKLIQHRHSVVETSRFFQQLTGRKNLFAFADDGAGNAFVTLNGRPAVYLADHDEGTLSAQDLSVEDFLAGEWKSSRSTWRKAKGFIRHLTLGWRGKPEPVVMKALLRSTGAKVLSEWVPSKEVSPRRVFERTLQIGSTVVTVQHYCDPELAGPNKTGDVLFFETSESGPDAGRGIVHRLLEETDWEEPVPDFTGGEFFPIRTGEET